MTWNPFDSGIRNVELIKNFNKFYLFEICLTALILSAIYKKNLLSLFFFGIASVLVINSNYINDPKLLFNHDAIKIIKFTWIFLICILIFNFAKNYLFFIKTPDSWGVRPV